jgi:hypothetical protein
MSLFVGTVSPFMQALSCVTYALNRHADWKKRGIKDEDITMQDFHSADPSEEAALQ